MPTVAVLIATTLALSLAGCSGGGGTTNGGTSTSANTPPPKTYTEPNLVAILTAANKSLNAGGTVKDNGLASSTSKPSDEGLYAKITELGGSFLPAVCGALVDKVEGDLSVIGEKTAAYSATLTYATSFLSLTSSASSTDVKTVAATFDTDLAAATKQCSSAQITLKGFQETFGFTTVAARTDAGTTNAFTETANFDGVPLTYTFIVAVDGNLLIGFEGVSPQGTLTAGEQAVNAAVAAAKGKY